MASGSSCPVDLGGKGEILGDPRFSCVYFIIVQFGAGHYSLEEGRIFKKLTMIPEGGGIGHGCKNAKAHLLALELLLKIKRGVCVCVELCYCSHSLLSRKNNHNMINCSAMLVYV